MDLRRSFEASSLGVGFGEHSLEGLRAQSIGASSIPFNAQTGAFSAQIFFVCSSNGFGSALNVRIGMICALEPGPWAWNLGPGQVSFGPGQVSFGPGGLKGIGFESGKAGI